MRDRVIDKFIKAVTKDMGGKQRNEVKKELRAHILDSAEALAAERNVPVDDSIINEIIKRMGSPEDIAAIYPAGKKSILFDRVILAGIAIFVIFIIIIIGVGLLAAYQHAHVEHREDSSSHAGASKINLELDNANGKIDIVESATDTIEVIYSVSANDGHLGDVVTNTTYVQDGDTLKVKSQAKIADDYGIQIGYFIRQADVLVKVPENSQCQMELATRYGGVTVTALNGSSMVIDSGNGGINIQGGRYDSIDAHTSYGAIDASYGANKSMFETGNGDIDLDSSQATEDLSAITSYGHIKAKYNSTIATFKTGNGNIDLYPDQTIGDLNAATDYGQVHVIVPNNILFSVDARTSYGHMIHDSIPMVVTESDQSHVVGYTKDGPGALKMTLRSGNGDIEMSY